MDSRTLYKNLLGDLEIEGNDWVEVWDEYVPGFLLLIVRERDSLSTHLGERDIVHYKITECFRPGLPKHLVEHCGIFVPSIGEDRIYEVAEAIKEFYKYM